MRHFLFAFTFPIFFSAPFAHAVDRLDVSIGNMTRPSDTSPLFNSFRLGLSWNTDYLKYENDIIQQSLRIETSTGVNRTELGNVRDVVVAPVLHYQFNKIYGQPFAEISCGAAYISKTRWESYHDLSSRRLFGDRIGVGYTFDETEISLNFFHFSNAGLHRPNPGADMVLIRASLKI
ncbi:MAG: acyloxyacyl hydrolase [Moraxellaceae bacterium]|nr:MAG: acyloxyacyl hydrolase [Moraxellaceae bacterium]